MTTMGGEDGNRREREGEREEEKEMKRREEDGEWYDY